MSVIVDQLRISDDGQTLFLDAHINKASYFDDLYISKVTICTEDQITETSPLSYGDGFVYQATFDSGTREVHLVLNSNTLNEKFTKKNLSSNMFFAYIEWGGTPASDTPCVLDENVTLAVTFDYGVLFNQAMVYTKELANTCEVPVQFIDFILNVEALKLAIETEHYVPAVKRWKWLMDITDRGIAAVYKRCGCHG